jgi:deoxyribonuclease V
MIAALDVAYRATGVVTACVAFDGWTATAAVREVVVRSVGAPASYEPGQFYRRELCYLEAVLAQLAVPVDVVIVDGYVWLGEGRMGLGAHLHAALAGPAVVGIAKTRFEGARAVEVRRGASARPLYITAEGIDPAVVAAHVAAMAGPHRVPQLVKRADMLSRMAVTA